MAQLAVDKQVQDNLRWNFSVNVWDIMFITLGFTLVSRETVMPVFVSTLTDSKILIGLIPATFTLGFYLPQLFSANFTERLRFKKPFVMTIGFFGERLPYLLIGLAIYRLAVPNPTLMLVIFFLLLGVASGSAGLATPAWFDMIAKVIPVSRRGIWSGVGHSLGAGMGIAGAFLVGRILQTVPYPNNFALLFGLAFVAVTISWVGLALTREPPSTGVKETIPTIRYLRRLPGILRRDRNYARFILSRSVVQLGTMASGFYMVYGIDRFVIDGAGVGRLTAILIASQAVMNLVWGVMGDRLGHKLVLTSAAFMLAAAAFLAAFAPSQLWLALVFVLIGAYMAADTVSSLNIILEFCAPEDRPTYIGLTNTLLAPVFAMAPLIGGWLATVAGYQNMFFVSLIAATLGASLLTVWVREPRRTVAS